MNSLRNVDLNLLVIFEAIYTAGNISQAANQLGVSQPTISNALTRLRGALDDKLFVRAGRGVRPTPKATKLISPVREALQTIQIGLFDSDIFNPVNTQRNFKIMIAEPMEPVLMPKLINDLPQGHGITFDYFSPLTLDVEQSLMTGTIELAIFLRPTKNPDLNMEVLCPIDLVGVARKDHPRLGNVERLTKADMARLAHVTLNLQPGKIRNTRKFSVNQTPLRQVMCQVSSAGVIARIAGSTDLFGMIPRLYAAHAARFYGLKTFDLPVEMNKQQLFMIWHSRHNGDNSHIWLRERIKSIAAAAMNA